MRPQPSCPRCLGALRAPGLWSNDWVCEAHGAVPPLQPVVQPSADLLAQVSSRAAVPLWLPWPLPTGWLLTGVAHAGDERSGARATAVACSGPSPLGGSGELVLVAEEPAVGLGARYAGLSGPDAGSVSEDTAAHAKIAAAGHPTALWCLPSPPDRAAYVGEALGFWLWSVLWPQGAGYLLFDDVQLVDLRDAGHTLDVPYGALSPRLLDPSGGEPAG